MNTLARAAAALGLIRADDSAAAVQDGAPRVFTPPPRIPSSRDPRTLDAVYRSLFILETAARQLTLDVWRGKTKLTATEIPTIITRPDINGAGAGAFLAETVSSLAQRGNAYWRLTYDGTVCRNAQILNPLKVSVSRDERTGRDSYTYNGYPIRPSSPSRGYLTTTRQTPPHGRAVRWSAPYGRRSTSLLPMVL